MDSLERDITRNEIFQYKNCKKIFAVRDCGERICDTDFVCYDFFSSGGKR